jgi:hypothetical protein
MKLQRNEIYRQVSVVDSLQRELSAERIRTMAKDQESIEYQKLFKDSMEEIKISEKEIDELKKKLDTINKDKS